MRAEVEKLSFAAVGQGGVLADIDTSGDFQIAFAIDVDSIAGTPTNVRAVAVPLEDQILGSAAEHLRKTADITAAGVFLLGNRGTAIAEPAMENVYKKIRVFADFTGGTAPTITGSLYVMRKRGF